MAVGDFDTTTIEIGIGDYTIPIPVSEGEQSGQQVFQGNLSCVVNACSVDVSIATGAYLSANANATIINWFADAMARVFGSQVGLTVTPNAGPACNVVNDSTPFKVGVCANETP